MTSSIEVSAFGMQAARKRVEIASSNLANMEVTDAGDGKPYRAKQLRVAAIDLPGTFSSALEKATLKAPVVTEVLESDAVRREYHPGHPDADAQGFVSYPDINMIATMTDLMSATRVYQANVAAIDSAKTIKKSASEILTA
jgi:flagellar basal-body rod protein FlgC